MPRKTEHRICQACGKGISYEHRADGKEGGKYCVRCFARNNLPLANTARLRMASCLIHKCPKCGNIFLTEGEESGVACFCGWRGYYGRLK